MEHTQGKLVLRIDGRPELNNQNEILETEDGQNMVVYFRFNNREDARRLVACWNAFDGLDTSLVESMVNVPEFFFKQVELLAQRDELIAGLERIRQSECNGLTRLERAGIEALIAKHKEASHG